MRELKKLIIWHLKGMRERYIEGEGYEWAILNNAIEALEQEPDKIKAEIEKLDGVYITGDHLINNDKYVRLWDVLRIINKYKVESEDEG